MRKKLRDKSRGNEIKIIKLLKFIVKARAGSLKQTTFQQKLGYVRRSEFIKFR